MKSTKNVVSLVTPLTCRVAEELGYTLWDLEYVKEGTEWYLRITIDNEEGITLDDCEKMSRAIDPVLDENDPIEGNYHLEVSSPGVERVIRTDSHLSWAVGQVISISLYAAIEGCKTVVGQLSSYDTEKIVLVGDDGDFEIPRKNIAKMNKYFEF